MEILKLSNIQTDLQAFSKEDVFKVIANLAVQEGYATDIQAVEKSLAKREAESTTGMMDGFAIPHAKDKAITSPGILIFKLSSPVEWNSLDGKPIDFVVSLVIPDASAGDTHLKLLSQVSRLLMKKDVTKQFKESSSATDIYQTIINNIDLSI